MGIDPVTLAWIGAGISGASFIAGQEARRDQKAAMERQYEAERKRAEIQNLRQVRQAIRQQRIAASTMANKGALGGTSGSSGVAGGISSTGSQLAGNISYMNAVGEQNAAIGQAQMDAGSAAGRAAEAAAWGGLGQTIFSAGGGAASIFGKPPTSTNTYVPTPGAPW